MLDEIATSSCMERLSQLDFWPRGNISALRDIQAALAAANTEEIAARVVDEWVKLERKAPKAADLRRLIYEENDKHPSVPRSRCKFCKGYGFIPTDFLLNMNSVGKPISRQRLYRDYRSLGMVYRFALGRNRDMEPLPNADQRIMVGAEYCLCQMEASEFLKQAFEIGRMGAIHKAVA